MGKTRMKPDVPIRLKDNEALDKALYEIAQYRQECKRIDSEADARINDVKEAAAQLAEPIREKIEKLEQAIAAYVEYNRPELFKDKKSLELNFGIVGYRQSTRISISNKNTLELLRTLGFAGAIRTTEQVDKTVMAEWPDERLAEVEARKIVEDKFFYEIKEDAVAERVSGTKRRVSA